LRRDHNRELGSTGEDLAAVWLGQHDFRIVQRNLRTPYGELDIIAERRGEIHIIEVKTRHGTGFGDPLEAIDRRKQEHLRRATAAVLASGLYGLPRPCRGVHVDAISVLADGHSEPVIRFLEDVLV